MTVSLAPASTALLVMDYQPAILGSIPDADLLIQRARDTTQWWRSVGGQVGYVRVGFTDEDYAGFPPGSMMGDRVKGSRPAMNADAPTTSVHPDLDVLDGDFRVRKTRVGAFSTTGLSDQLRNAGVTTLLLAGVHTSGVVTSTVREAHDIDYRTVVVADLCSDPDQATHEFLINTLLTKHAEVVTTDELASLVGEPADA